MLACEVGMMAEKINTDKMIAKNPNVDKGQLNQALKTLKELQSIGVKRSEYNLVSPFSHRAVSNKKG